MRAGPRSKYPALAKIVEAAHQIDTRDRLGALAMKAILMAVAEARISERPQPLDKAPRQSPKMLLLYCPTQGGWQTGQWDPKKERWVSNLNREPLSPHWTDVPEGP